MTITATTASASGGGIAGVLMGEALAASETEAGSGPDAAASFLQMLEGMLEGMGTAAPAGTEVAVEPLLPPAMSGKTIAQEQQDAAALEMAGALLLPDALVAQVLAANAAQAVAAETASTPASSPMSSAHAMAAIPALQAKPLSAGLGQDPAALLLGSQPDKEAPAPAGGIDADLVAGALSGTSSSTGATSNSAGNFNPLLMTGQLSAAAAAATAATSSGGNSAPEPHLHHNVGSERWADELGNRLTMMAVKGEQTGSLRLSPEHLGPLEVQISLSDDKASVWFGAQHADTRAALAEALPRLRELFAASGMQLSDAGVARDGARQDPRAQDLRRSLGDRSGGERAEVSVRTVSRLGLLDTYA